MLNGGPHHKGPHDERPRCYAPRSCCASAGGRRRKRKAGPYSAAQARLRKALVGVAAGEMPALMSRVFGAEDGSARKRLPSGRCHAARNAALASSRSSQKGVGPQQNPAWAPQGQGGRMAKGVRIYLGSVLSAALAIKMRIVLDRCIPQPPPMPRSKMNPPVNQSGRVQISPFWTVLPPDNCHRRAIRLDEER